MESCQRTPPPVNGNVNRAGSGEGLNTPLGAGLAGAHPDPLFVFAVFVVIAKKRQLPAALRNRCLWRRREAMPGTAQERYGRLRGDAGL